MTFAAIAIGAAAVIGTGVSAGMAGKASSDSRKQYKSAVQAADRIYGNSNQQIQSYYQPYIKAGNQNLRLLQAALSPVGMPDYSMPEKPGAAPVRANYINRNLQNWNPSGGSLAEMVANQQRVR